MRQPSALIAYDTLGADNERVSVTLRGRVNAHMVESEASS